MVLESTIICVDNSEYMRNGDYIPNRLQAQQDAVNTVCHCKLMANPENNVGLLTLANTEVLATLTTDGGKILTSLHKVQPSGFINLLTGIRIAHLALKHRQSKNHKMRIVVFVGSPIKSEEKDAVKIAKRLKKENVNIDIINFGETEENQSLLEMFVSTINGREGTGSHLVTIPPSPHLADALLSSPIIQGEDGTGPTNFGSGGGFDFGVDPNEDPELALALRVSMEEQRQRQQEEERRATQESTGASGTPVVAATEDASAKPAAATETGSKEPTATPSQGGSTEEEMLRQALAMSLEPGAMESVKESAKEPIIPPSVSKAGGAGFPNFFSMTTEEQIAYAMQLSLQQCQDENKDAEEPMDVDQDKPKKTKKEEKSDYDKMGMESDFSEVMSDPAFLQDVLQSLPGVDPDSSMVREAVGSLTSKEKDKKEKKEKKKDDKEDK